MLLDFLVFAVSLLVLAKSADIAVRQVIRIARHYSISDFTAGFILIAVATSVPELLVGIFSSMSNAGGISVGNVLGANIVDLLLVMGLLVFFYKVSVVDKKLVENSQVMLFLTFIPLVFLLSGSVERSEGLVLLLLFLLYCFFSFKQKISVGIKARDGLKISKPFLILGFSLLLLFISSRFLVDSTISIATFLQVPQSLIAVVIVSLGTTVPELATALSAARLKRFEIAFGDLVGSVIVNSTLVLGVAAVIRPLVFNQQVIFTAVFFLVIAELLIVGLATLQKRLDRKIGLTLLSFYFLFLLAEIGFVNF